MKNYKSYLKTFIGVSDIGCLTVRACGDVGTIEFGEDGVYYAYIVDRDTEIPTSYEEVFKTDEPWLWIYDDDGRIACFSNEYGFIIYIDAATLDCIIKVR